MGRFLSLAVLLLAVAAGVPALPAVDGKVSAGEYGGSQTLGEGALTLNWAPDGHGGVFLALSAPTKGWLAVGLGSQRMSGAYVYIGFVGAGGQAVFSEQTAKGHTHKDSGKKTADQSAVARTGANTVLEFHVPAGQLPFAGKAVPFIVASSGSPDLTSFHDGQFDTGTFSLP